MVYRVRSWGVGAMSSDDAGRLGAAVVEDAAGQAWDQTALAREAAGDKPGAVQAWQAFLAQHPDDLAGRRRLVELYRALKLRAEAVEHLRVLAEACPDDLVVWRSLVWAAAADVDVQLPALIRLVDLDPDDTSARIYLAKLLCRLNRTDEALEHLKVLPESVNIGGVRGSMVAVAGSQVLYERGGTVEMVSHDYFRGEHTNFYPTDESFQQPDVLQTYFMHGLAPGQPFVDKTTPIAAFGSCFAAHISVYLNERGYNVLTMNDNTAYVSRLADGIVNTYAIRQQFEWAWLNKTPTVDLWHGYDAAALGYNEHVRLASKALFDATDLFVITLGLSEVWYDEPTGEVFWRAVPLNHYDASRHKFRVVNHAENLDNLRAIYALMREFRPEASILFSVSPIPLKATFRPIACTSADAVSKAALRSALDEFLREAQPQDPRLHYFPSYEIALRAFEHPYRADRRHIHEHILNLNMTVFERYYCKDSVSEAFLQKMFRGSRGLDRKVMEDGHEAVPQRMLAKRMKV